MGETVQTTTTTTPTEDPSVLAEAAVASVAVSAVAAERATDAQATADEAAAKADVALHVAASTPAGIGEADARRIAREEAEAYVAGLATAAKAAEPAPADIVTVQADTVEVHEEVAPPSVAKANPDGPEGDGKRRFLDRWLG